ncbi:leucine zipper transcription factor 1 [Paramuricea clavata]|uniref:Leucine zipper transcription factor-like protein 1 n=1 Tax=Paramuricea clavata TaxID=317549 RepID=A0A6S7IRN0_PARCT|nr:leucine zipper transcription factor 1 [Paramuricea clavata]
MKPLVKAVKSAHHENKDWKREMFKFLLNYRATPHSTTGKSPSELLYNRKIQTKLPQVTVENDSSLHQEVKERDERLKKNQKEYADSKRRVKCADIKKSDLVLVRQLKANKMSTKYDPIPYEVTNRRGNRITAIRNGKYITRNISFFKKYHPRHGRSLESTEIMDEENYSSDEDVHEEHEQYDGLRQKDCPRQNNGQRQDDGPRYPARKRQREINRLQEENGRLKEKIKISETMAASVLDEKSKLKADLAKTQSELLTMSQSADGDELKELEKRMESVKLEMESVRKASSAGGDNASEITDQLTNAKHEILRLQHDLQEKEKELTKKFNETTQYINMKQMLQTKNEQMKKLRQRLKKYEPDFES